MRIGHLPDGWRRSGRTRWGPPLGDVENALGGDRVELVGRDAEARRLAVLLAGTGTRLISLSGRPGVGKSAMLSIVPALIPAATDVWNVDLAASPLGADLLAEVVRELAVTPTSELGLGSGRPAERLAALIGASRVALVVDHADACVIDESALQELIDGCPELTVVIATATALRGQVDAVRLAPLAVAPLFARWEEVLASPSARLFAVRAERASADFRLDPSTADAVAEICRLVGGLPLAIELAAARSSMLSLGRLARELRSDGPTPAALDILTPRPGGALVGIREALASTRRLLTAREDQLFSRVATFRGPFTFDAALGVSDAAPGAVLDDLGALIDLRLLEPSPDDTREPSFVMLPLVRSFAREGAGASRADLERRSALLRRLTRDAASAAAQAASSDAVHAVHIMRHDIGGEIRRLGETDFDEAVAMAVDAASVLGGFSDASAVGEILDEAILRGTVGRLSRTQQARVWLWASSALAFSPDGADLRDIVRERWQRGADLVDTDLEPHLALQARLIAIGNGSTTGDLALSARAALEGRALAEALALPAWLARFEVWSAAVTHARGDSAGAVALAASALSRGERVGDAKAIVGATMMLHTLPPGSVPDAVAVPELEDALRLALEDDDPVAESFVLAALTQRDLRNGDPAAAAVWCSHRLAAGRRRGWSHLASISFVHAALIGTAMGEYAFAARMIGAVRSDEERTLRSMAPTTLDAYRGAEELIRRRLGAAHGARLVAAGGLMSTLDAVALAVRWLEDHSAAEPPAIVPPPGGITAREQDVLALLAEGMTNKQIAERLGLSVKTVMHHSVAIYRKLGVRGRAEATAAAFRYGLLRAASDAIGS